ncbi:MAG: hypothetical protein U0R44_02175 [Candidatus Micrarchaeia archaeon]
MADKPKSYGEWAFLGGVAIAVLLGLLAALGAVPSGMLPIIFGVLGVLGLVVGLLNITDKEVVAFLVATIALMSIPNGLQPIVALLATLPGGTAISMSLNAFLSAIAVFIAPAAFVNAIKAIRNLAKD